MRSSVKRPAKTKGQPRRIELGQHIVVDPAICHGKPTFKGTRIMVWQVLDELAHGMAAEEILRAWGGRLPLAAIAECVTMARASLLDERGRLRDDKLVHCAA